MWYTCANAIYVATAVYICAAPSTATLAHIDSRKSDMQEQLTALSQKQLDVASFPEQVVHHIEQDLAEVISRLDRSAVTRMQLSSSPRFLLQSALTAAALSALPHNGICCITQLSSDPTLLFLYVSALLIAVQTQQ